MDLGKESLQVALDFSFKPVVFVLLLLRLVRLLPLFSLRIACNIRTNQERLLFFYVFPSQF